jgi:1,6-anhydro-N-acetylmuramate kinase
MVGHGPVSCFKVAGGIAGQGAKGKMREGRSCDMGAWGDVGHLAGRGGCRDGADRRPYPCEFGPHAYRPYTAAEQATLRAALGNWPGEPGRCKAAEVVETAHAELLSRFSGVDVVGFHGQTLAHDPRGRGTHQAGNGALLAEVLNLPVVWDFRTSDVTLGGQGAPLAPFFHFALAKRRMATTGPLAFLNLGGVGNLTWVDPRPPPGVPPAHCLAFDTGPANAPINDLARRASWDKRRTKAVPLPQRAG